MPGASAERRPPSSSTSLRGHIFITTCRERLMSTSMPFTLIEGAMAIPRLRPLDSLPAPFGRDWALLPPNISLRAELKALYAAVLRTFCVNRTAFRSLCRWDARRPSAPASAPGNTLQAEAAPVGPSVPEAVQDATDFIASAAPAAEHRSPTRRAALAGGACAVGGAAVLAWLTISHSSQYQTSVQATHERRAAKPMVPAHRDQGAAQSQAAPNRNEVARVIPSHAASSAATNRPGLNRLTVSESLPVAVTTPAASPAISSPPLKPVLDASKASPSAGDTNSSGLNEQQTLQTSQRSLLPNTSNARTSRTNQAQARESGLHAHGKLHRATPRVTSETKRPIHSLSPRAETRIEAPAFTPRSVANPSLAGGFSPFAPAALGVDEYASVRTSANTRLPTVGSARSQSHPINNDSTDWASHVSQRRITDAPEQFSK